MSVQLVPPSDPPDFEEVFPGFSEALASAFRLGMRVGRLTPLPVPDVQEVASYPGGYPAWVRDLVMEVLGV